MVRIGQSLLSPRLTGSKVKFLHRSGVRCNRGNNLIQWSLNCVQWILGAPRAHFLYNQVVKCNLDDFEEIWSVVLQ
jgi:hypothetical protein